MNSIDQASAELFCSNPNKYFLRVTKDAATQKHVILAESKESLWTWIKVWFLHRSSYRLSNIVEKLATTPSISNEMIQRLRKSIDITKYMKKHPSASHVQKLYQQLLQRTKVAPKPVPSTKPPFVPPHIQAEDEEQPPLLPELSEIQREAELGIGPLYSKAFHDKCDDFHRKGATWSPTEHAQFFAEGLLQYYVSTETEIDVTGYYNYDQYTVENPPPLSTYDSNKFLLVDLFFETKGEVSLQDRTRRVALVKRAFQSLQKNKDHPLILLGGKFQRYKALTEKVYNHVKTPQGADCMPLLLKIDKRAEQAQTLVYHWVKDWCRELKEFFKEKTLDEAERRIGKFNPPLPSFFKHEQYLKFIEPEYQFPEEVECQSLVT